MANVVRNVYVTSDIIRHQTELPCEHWPWQRQQQHEPEDNMTRLVTSAVT